MLNLDPRQKLFHRSFERRSWLFDLDADFALCKLRSIRPLDRFRVTNVRALCCYLDAVALENKAHPPGLSAFVKRHSL